jgi:hypothetical protein
MPETLAEAPATLTETTAAPVSAAQRLKLLDALRGVALLGILLMNIPGFALPNYFSESFRNDPTNINFWVNAVISIFFEGKMRALFGMIFGAGVLLFVLNKEKSGKPTAGLFYRRMLWLVLFGVIHAHLILWYGDILYLYGICGMVVYLCRKIKPVYLVLGVPLVAVFDFTAGTLFYQHIRAKRIAYVEASAAAKAETPPLTEAQKQALVDWREIEKTMIPNREDVKENTRKMKSDYSTVASLVRPLAWKFETVFLPIAIWDSLALDVSGAGPLSMGLSLRAVVEARVPAHHGGRLRHRLAPGHLQFLRPLCAFSQPRSPSAAHGAGADRVGKFDLPLPADSAGDGARGRAHPFVPRGLVPTAVPLPRSRGADGVYQLHHALGPLHAVLLRLRLELLRRAGVLSSLHCCPGHLGGAIDPQPALAALLPIRPPGMAMAQSDLLEVAAVPAAGE